MHATHHPEASDATPPGPAVHCTASYNPNRQMRGKDRLSYPPLTYILYGKELVHLDAGTNTSVGPIKSPQLVFQDPSLDGLVAIMLLMSAPHVHFPLFTLSCAT